MFRKKKSWTVEGFLVEGVNFDGIIRFRAKDLSKPYLVYNVHLDENGMSLNLNSEISGSELKYYQDVFTRLDMLNQKFHQNYSSFVKELQ